MSYEEYGELSETGYDNREPTKPEDDFFHSIYIAGRSRINSSGVEEKSEMLQIRGVEYNLESLNIAIIHTKGVLAKIRREDSGKENVECFSYQEGSFPWKGTSGNQCGSNSAERAGNDFCEACRAQIIVAGIYCNDSGQPVLNDNKKPIFVFVRGKGMKYSGISEYLNQCSKRTDIQPLFTPVTNESTAFEKSVVNNKRFVTKISIEVKDSKYGPKKVFKLESGSSIDNKSVMEILNIAKKTIKEFNEKMDWSKNKTSDGSIKIVNSSEGLEKIPDTQPVSVQSPPKETSSKTDKQFSFDDLDF